MKGVILFTVILVVGVALADDKYTTAYDNSVDVDEILKNERLVRQYIDCLLGNKPCTKQGLELRKHVNEALETSCAKCSDKQKEIIKKIIKYLIKNKPDWWKELCDKFDPDGKYQKEYADLLTDIVE